MAKSGRKMIGKSRRIAASFTVEQHILDEFKDYCKKTGMSASFYVQRKIEEFLEEKRKETE